MAALYPRASSGLRAGYDKGAILSSTCKLFALDAPYVELNRLIAGCIVVELDSVLRVEEFRIRLLEILGPRRMPNLIVGRITASGFLSRPHLIWILKKPVWYADCFTEVDPKTGEITKRGKKTKSVKKYHAVQRGLTQLLLPLGADPSYHNIWKPKCPLSPFWTAIIANDDVWHELGDFDLIPNWPRKILDDYAMTKVAATMRADAIGDLPTPSNLAWQVIGHLIEPLARLQLSVRGDDFIAASKNGVDALSAWFERQIRDDVEREVTPGGSLDRLMKQRCDFAARYCLKKLDKPGRRKVRGRDRDVISGEMTLEQRQKKAFARTAAHRSAVFLWNLQKEMYVAIQATGQIDKTEFIKNLDTVGKSAAYKHWDEACKRLGLEFREGAHREKARPITGEKVIASPALPVSQSMDFVRSPSIFAGQQVQTAEIVPPDPGYQLSTAGPSEQQRSTYAARPAAACSDTVNRVLEPA